MTMSAADATIDLRKGDEGPSECVRLVHISDTHTKDYDILPPGDILVHSGDFTNGGIEFEISKFAAFLERIQHQYKYVVVVLGNHEIGMDSWSKDLLQSALGSNIIILHDNFVKILGISFWGTSWNNTSQAFGINEVGRAAKWKLIPETTDLLITHIPPQGILDLAFDPRNKSSEPCALCGLSHVGYLHWGCFPLYERVKALKVPIHLFGHVHDDVGVKKSQDGFTVYSNAAMDIYKRPNIIDVITPRSAYLHTATTTAALKDACVETDTFLTACSELQRNCTSAALDDVWMQAGKFFRIQIYATDSAVLDLDKYSPNQESVILWRPSFTHGLTGSVVTLNQQWLVHYDSYNSLYVISSAVWGSAKDYPPAFRAALMKNESETTSESPIFPLKCSRPTAVTGATGWGVKESVVPSDGASVEAAVGGVVGGGIVSAAAQVEVLMRNRTSSWQFLPSPSSPGKYRIVYTQVGVEPLYLVWIQSSPTTKLVLLAPEVMIEGDVADWQIKLLDTDS